MRPLLKKFRNPAKPGVSLEVSVNSDTGQDMNIEYKDLLIKQLEMNELAWKDLEKHGVIAEAEFCLNFRFTSPNHARCESLIDFMCRKTNYDVHIAPEKSFRKNWYIEGATKPFKVSKKQINEWVSEMVRLGMKHDCKFDGWWVWKYEDFACPGGPCTTKALGSITENGSRLIRQPAQLRNQLNL